MTSISSSVTTKPGVFETGFERSPKAHILAMRWRAITVRPARHETGWKYAGLESFEGV